MYLYSICIILKTQCTIQFKTNLVIVLLFNIFHACSLLKQFLVLLNSVGLYGLMVFAGFELAVIV